MNTHLISRKSLQGKWVTEGNQVRAGTCNCWNRETTQVGKYLAFVVNPFHMVFEHRIANECVKNREARIGIDLVKDEVENSLEREVENIKTYQQRMQKMLARVNQQIETNHSMQVKFLTILKQG